MIHVKFVKDPDGRWYLDLPAWDGSRAELEMVMGADELLDLLAKGPQVYMWLDKEPFFDCDVLYRLELGPVGKGGAYYFSEVLKGKRNSLWLCDVCLFVLGEFPTAIYYQVISN